MTDKLRIMYLYIMESQITAPVQMTHSAIAEIKRLLTESSKPFLRVGVKGGGCSGMTYVLEFDDKTDQDDQFEMEGVPCIMNRSHAIYLLGMLIDWSGGLNARGFTFTNPNASSTCGCGTSFAI
jgi:iron-sulfur cluster assembly accessory protein